MIKNPTPAQHKKFMTNLKIAWSGCWKNEESISLKFLSEKKNFNFMRVSKWENEWGPEWWNRKEFFETFPQCPSSPRSGRRLINLPPPSRNHNLRVVLWVADLTNVVSNCENPTRKAGAVNVADGARAITRNCNEVGRREGEANAAQAGAGWYWKHYREFGKC